MTNLLVFGKVGTEAEAGLPPSCQSNLTSDPAMSPHVSITTPPPPSQVLAFSPFAIENSTSPDKGLSEQNPSAHVSITTTPRPSQIEDGSCFSALSSSQGNSIIRTHLECSSMTFVPLPATGSGSFLTVALLR